MYPVARKINEKGLNLIKEFEGLKLTAYRDVKGILTIGYGHTGEDVVEGQKISAAQAEMLLKNDVDDAERGVTKLVRVLLTDNQYSALVSFTYNIGINALAKSTLLKYLNQGGFTEAADQLLRWNKAGGKEYAGLTRRRKAERALFNEK